MIASDWITCVRLLLMLDWLVGHGAFVTGSWMLFPIDEPTNTDFFTHLFSALKFLCLGLSALCLEAMLCNSA